METIRSGLSDTDDLMGRKCNRNAYALMLFGALLAELPEKLKSWKRLFRNTIM